MKSYLFSEVPNENALVSVFAAVLPNENPVDGLDSSDFFPNVNPEFFEEFSFSDSVDPNVNPEEGLSFDDDPNENPVVTVLGVSTVSLDFEFSLEPKENPVGLLLSSDFCVKIPDESAVELSFLIASSFVDVPNLNPELDLFSVVETVFSDPKAKPLDDPNVTGSAGFEFEPNTAPNNGFVASLVVSVEISRISFVVLEDEYFVSSSFKCFS